MKSISDFSFCLIKQTSQLGCGPAAEWRFLQGGARTVGGLIFHHNTWWTSGQYGHRLGSCLAPFDASSSLHLAVINKTYELLPISWSWILEDLLSSIQPHFIDDRENICELTVPVVTSAVSVSVSGPITWSDPSIVKTKCLYWSHSWSERKQDIFMLQKGLKYLIDCCLLCLKWSRGF